MATLIHNQVFRILEGELGGFYRVVLTEVSNGGTVAAQIEKDFFGEVENSNRNEAAQERKSRRALCGKLIWLDNAMLQRLALQEVLQMVEVERENFHDSPADTKRFEHRKAVMADFLDFDLLRSTIRAKGTIGPLVKKAVATHGVGRTMIYQCWSLLCRHGFSESSLRVRYDRCGAPGKTQDCEPGGRRKNGRKTKAQRIASMTGSAPPEVQPGMNSQWRQIIMIADRRIATPKPKFAERYTNIIREGFTRHYQHVDGKTARVELTPGSYPNKEQVRRVIEVEIPRLDRLREMTTKGHFARSKRGITGRSWKGVAGPGHTWQIDSTIADMYLRSSINRAWIIGRPIVYIMVDVWSTAIVGFYVCLRGPSWEMARTALFSSTAAPALIGKLWGYQPIETLFPAPSLPSVLLCDRGEYISQAAKQTAAKLLPRMSFAPPYRPDMKGLVEVLHRIKKDHQFWIPGAIDARRAEYDLRKFDPKKAIFTVREYVIYLHGIFAEYNLTADRSKRLDTHMIADGVMPSPAGLWRWGHEVGIGTLRYRSQSELITTLLPQRHATINREGIYFDKLAYELDFEGMSDWTAKARNFGSWQVPAFHYPGTVSRIWTPNMAGAGLLELPLSEQANASRDQTYEEVQDAFEYAGVSRAHAEHQRVVQAVSSLDRSKELVEHAKVATAEAVNSHQGPIPPLSLARTMEATVTESHASPVITGGNEDSFTPSCQRPREDLEDEPDSFFQMMNAVLQAKGS